MSLSRAEHASEQAVSGGARYCRVQVLTVHWGGGGGYAEPSVTPCLECLRWGPIALSDS